MHQFSGRWAAPRENAMTLSIDAALAGKRVLITGTSGFIGKALLETLMRELPGIERIVLLLRGNAAHPDPWQRFRAEVLASSVFDRRRADDAAALQRQVERQIEVVAGEITAPRLGLSDAEHAALAQRTDVIINVAASVNFREELDKALAINTLCVREIAALARRAGGVPLVQVSTCYVSGWRRGRIDETLAPAPRAALPLHADGHVEVDALIERLQREVARVRGAVLEPQARSRALIALGLREARRHGWNDTYTFTKWLGEQQAAALTRGGTLTIVRPAIVESAWQQPQRGWIEGMKVGDAIVLAYARGKTRLFPARRSGIADIIPVDLVVNAITLACAEAVARPGARRVYQAASSARQPIRIGDYIDLCQSEMRARRSAYPRLIRAPLTQPFRTVPRPLFLAYLAAAGALVGTANGVARLLGASRPLALHEALQTTRQLAVVFSFYTAPRCVYDNQQLLALAASLDERDRRRFEVDARCVDWREYVQRVHLPGLERFAVRGEAAAAADAAEPTAGGIDAANPVAVEAAPGVG
jgi:nucleoside-diphosphate-sugar epimerase